MRRFSSMWDWASGGKALVVESDRLDLRRLEAMLAALGFAVVGATDAGSAIAAFEAVVPDIVFMDVATTGDHSRETVQRIKSLAGGRFVPVIFLTASAQEDTPVEGMEKWEETGFEMGGDDFLGKPVNPMHLRAKIAAFGRVLQLYRTVQAQQDQLVFEQELAKQAYAKAVMADPSQLEGIHSLQRPASIFSGDIVLVERSPSGALHVLVGDFTGHGLAAAIGALPAADVFRGMTAKGFAPAEILAEINRKLRHTLPTGMFLAAALVCLDEEGRWAGIRNSGLPDVLILDRTGASLRDRVPSTSVPLGILDSVEPGDLRWIEVEPGDQIVVTTDGIVEARDPEGDFFGDGRLWSCLAGEGGEGAFQRLVAGLDTFTGGAPQEDDLTLAVIPCGRRESWPIAAQPRGGGAAQSILGVAAKPPAAQGMDWRWELELGASALKRLDVAPLLVDTLVDLQSLRDYRQPLFTIMSELFNNALDHGVLRLESRIKDSPEGYAGYFRERRDRLAGLRRGRIHICLVARIESEGGCLEIMIEDDGPGFDHAAWRERSARSGTRFGRGLCLVRALCESLEFLGNGNAVKAIYRW